MDAGLTYRQIAGVMNISPVWLSKVMSRELKPEMRKRILQAIEKLKGNERPGDGCA